VVRQSGGAVEVASEPGRGTRFDIYLPVANELPESVRPWAEAGHDDATGDETILVVDDEELVRRAAARMLRGAGYNVLEADSGASAIALAETYQGRIHLVVTDMIMPEMTGQELANKLANARTDARVLFTSGSGEVLESNEPLDAGLVFLQKPFSGPALLHKVRETLDGPQPPEDGPEHG
jgi:CheY-like chemotaxis protein